MRLSCVHGFRRREIARCGQAHLLPGSHVHSDGADCFSAIADAGCTHHAVLIRDPGSRAQTNLFRWVDTMLSNVKNGIHETYHAVAHKHLPRYLAEFCWRFNRRFDQASLLTRLAIIATRRRRS